jgi:hypothetical protein
MTLVLRTLRRLLTMEDLLGHQRDKSLEGVLAFAISPRPQADQDFLRLPRIGPAQAALAFVMARLTSPVSDFHLNTLPIPRVSSLKSQVLLTGQAHTA